MASTGNLLINQLPKVDRVRLLQRCERFELCLSADLSVRGQPLSHAHFPLAGFVALVVDLDGYPALAVGMVGRESMVGAELLLGLEATPWRALVQGAGESLRIEAASLREAMAASPALQQVIQTNLLVRLYQQTLTPACERLHMIGPRLARWLLMSQDRAQANHFHMTHELMAQMLGVRRVGVTVAAGVLQRSGLIRYHRGELTVIDRAGLEAQACSCYALDQALHDRLTVQH